MTLPGDRLYRVKIHGDGEWQAGNQREGRKVQLAMDAAMSDIRAVEFTPSPDDPTHGLQANHRRAMDSLVQPELLDQIPKGEEVGSVTAPLGSIFWIRLPGNGRGL